MGQVADEALERELQPLFALGVLFILVDQLEALLFAQLFLLVAPQEVLELFQGQTARDRLGAFFTGDPRGKCGLGFCSVGPRGYFLDFCGTYAEWKF